LELVDITKSRELLSKLDDKLNLRKFEIVEPSLNSIFINVVGVPAVAPEPVASKIVSPAPKKAPLDKRMRKELISMVFGIIVFTGILIVNYFSTEPSMVMVALFVVGIGLSVFRYLKVKKQVEGEQKQVEGGPIQ
jgi:F0F1-type ATP synthase assembly protein I